MDYALARNNMVDGQVRTNRVTDPAVLDALRAIPREQFVPLALRSLAFVDEDLPLGNGRHLMEPMVFGRLLHIAAIRESDLVLDVGCGTGYSTAVIARIAAAVVGVEPDRELARRAEDALSALGIDNAAIVDHDLTLGYPDQAPYNVIILSGAVAEIPPSLLGQLADGGRLVAVVSDGRVGRAVVVTRQGGAFGRREAFDASVPFLPGFAPVPSFRF